MKSVDSQFREFSFIEKIRRSRTYSKEVKTGIGDDCAILSVGGDHDLLVSSDVMMEGIHFECDWGSPQQLAKKSVLINVSDVAAMGGNPRWMTWTLCLPKQKTEWAFELLEGINEMASLYGLDLLGGDISATRDLVSMGHTILGEVEKDQGIRRSGAQPGGRIFCSGTIGDSGLGLQLVRGAESYPRLSKEKQKWLRDRFLLPTPRVSLGRRLAKSNLISAMIDISDGLLQDLGHILVESGVCAAIDPVAVPISTAFRESNAPFSEALQSGEDYELLFVGVPGREDEILALADPENPITAIGEIQTAAIRVGDILDQQGNLLWNVDSRTGGFQHFS